MDISKVSFNVFIVGLVLIGCPSVKVYAQSDDSDLPSDSVTPPKQNMNTNFFGGAATNQNFFSNKNLSANSIFNNEAGGSSSFDSVDRESVRTRLNQHRPENSESFAADQNNTEQGSQIAPQVADAQPVQEQVSVASEAQASTTELNQSDPNIRDVLEQSRKIKEAIFGEEAVKKLPVGIKEKLDAKRKEQEMRF